MLRKITCAAGATNEAHQFTSLTEDLSVCVGQPQCVAVCLRRGGGTSQCVNRMQHQTFRGRTFLLVCSANNFQSLAAQLLAQNVTAVNVRLSGQVAVENSDWLLLVKEHAHVLCGRHAWAFLPVRFPASSPALVGAALCRSALRANPQLLFDGAGNPQARFAMAASA